MSELPVIQFKDRKISNFATLFQGVSWSVMDRGGNQEREVQAWLNEEDKIDICGIVFWGKVIVGQSKLLDPNTEGSHYYYRIHPGPDAFRREEPLYPHIAACVEKGEEDG